MPLLGYFFYVGSALVALLFVTDIYVPRQAVREEAAHTYNIPITAAPTATAPIVFSGETRDFGRPEAMTVADLASKAPQTAQAAAAVTSVQAQVRVAARQEPKPRKKVARRKVPVENRYAQIPDEWRNRYSYSSMAFARPFGW
jgi:hypothetical protein